MEENRESIERILSKASERTSPRDLSQDVLKAWKAESLPVAIRPLLPKWFWPVLSIIMGLAGVWVLNSKGSAIADTQLVDKWSQLTSYLQFDLSPVMISSILVMTIMIGLNVLYLNRGSVRTDHLPTL